MIKTPYRDSSSPITLQINLSGGDVAYAGITVPALVQAHAGIAVREVLAIVDCCRPQRTQMIDPEVKFPVRQFFDRVERIRAIAEELRRAGVIDRVVCVEPGDARIDALLKRYIGRVVADTHDCYGCGLVSYLYGFAESRTRFLVHYDADMLLHQAEGYDWIPETTQHLENEPNALAGTPRVSPPFAAAHGRPDGPSLHESDVFKEDADGFWRIGWFSARCFALDLQRLQRWLPLLTVKNPRYLLEVLVRKRLQRGYPPPTEMMIHRRACCHGARRLDLMTDKAFVLHPNDKGDRFLRLLPQLVESVRRGLVPTDQRGWENLKLDAWDRYLTENCLSAT